MAGAVDETLSTAGGGVKPRHLCIDPEWLEVPDCVLTRTFYTGVRFVARPDLWPEVGRFLELGLNVQLVIARESGDVAQYAEWATSEWMWSRISWVVGNEPDGTGEASWIMDPAHYAELWDTARVLSGPRWIAGMCSGNVQLAKPYLQPDAAGLAIHIYTLDPVKAKAKVTEYKTLGKKLWIGETHPAGGYKMGDYTWTDPVNDFCFSDSMVAGMGLWA